MAKQTIWMVTGALGIITIGGSAAIAAAGSDSESQVGPGVEIQGETASTDTSGLKVTLSSTLSPVSPVSALTAARIAVRTRRPRRRRAGLGGSGCRHAPQSRTGLGAAAGPWCVAVRVLPTAMFGGGRARRYYGTRSGRLAQG